MSAGVERSSLLAGGTRTRLLQAGPKEATEAVVFVHGNPGSADDWEQLVAAAGRVGKRAVAFDLPDFGQTVAPDGFAHDVPAYAGFIGEVLQELGIERVHLAIHDFGGPIGLAWARTAPDAIAGAILIDTGILPDYRWHVLARVWRTPIAGEALQASASRPFFRFMVNQKEPRPLPREFIDRMYDYYDRRTRRAVLKLYRATPDPGGVAADLIALFAPRDLPALVIWGEGDAYLSSSYAYRQREAFPSADVHMLAASGHWPFADAPETVERLLVEFLQRVESKTA